MRIRLTRSERLQIEDNRELLKQIATADVINAVNRNDGEKVHLWKRPIAEVQARDRAAHPVVLTFEILSKEELREYQEIIERLKNRDPGTEAPAVP